MHADADISVYNESIYAGFLRKKEWIISRTRTVAHRLPVSMYDSTALAHRVMSAHPIVIFLIARTSNPREMQSPFRHALASPSIYIKAAVTAGGNGSR